MSFFIFKRLTQPYPILIVHCGVEFLNMSKRMMNKVFSCADACDIQMYYQGTYSTHLNYEGVDKIENR